jgi:hypothetical protein
MTTAKVQLGGKKKSNGHKATCGCPICRNMMMKKGGGVAPAPTSHGLGPSPPGSNMPGAPGSGANSTTKPGMPPAEPSVPAPKVGGKKKSNGHKATCGCPICRNMMMKKGGSDASSMMGKSMSSAKGGRRTRKMSKKMRMSRKMRKSRRRG